MRWENTTHLGALALRSWHFAGTLAQAGHEVLLLALRSDGGGTGARVEKMA